MKTLTLRSSAIRPTEREAVRMRVPEPLYDMGRHMPFRGQKAILPRRHILRCYYYAKSARGKWVSAERAICGSRWNWYMCRGRTTPRFKAPEAHKAPFSDGRMNEIKVKREKRPALEKGAGTHDADNVMLPVRARAGTHAAMAGQGTADGAAYSFHFKNPAAVQFDANLISPFMSRSPGTDVGNPEKETIVAAVSAPSLNRPAASAMITGSRIEGIAMPQITRAKAKSATVAPQPPVSGAKPRPSETNGRAGGSLNLPGPGIAAGKTRTASAVGFFAATARAITGGTNDGQTGGATGGEAARSGWGAYNGSATVTGNPGKGVGYIGSHRKREVQLKVANACAEPE